jgi:4-carboxymuconolactone decarboxylase
MLGSRTANKKTQRGVIKLKRCEMQEEHDAEMCTILERIASYYGFVPRIYQELQRSPEAFKAFFYKNEQLATDSALPGLTKELIAIGAAAALGSEYCLDTHVKGAKRLGALDDQIFLAILLGASVAETTALSKSLRAWQR